MAITIDGKEYDETTLDNNVKNSIVQVQNSNQAIANLQRKLLLKLLRRLPKRRLSNE